MDILNLNEHFRDNMSSEYRAELEELLEEFKRGHYPNVLSKSADLRLKGDLDRELRDKLRMVEAISHSEIGEVKASSDIISELYHDSTIEWMLLGELAFMCDFKLARRILSSAVKEMEESGEMDRIKLARGYLVLAEAEENLEKYVRAIKYFKKGLTYFQDNEAPDQYMILYLHFKIGMMYSMKNEADESLHYLNKVIELAGDSNEELKINSLVTIAKTFGSKNENEKAYPYLQEALGLLEGSSLENKLSHAEALTEMAFYYFDQSKLAEAVPYYENAVNVYKRLSHVSHRKVGMVYMQYAYCLENMEQPNLREAGKSYEKAIGKLELTKDGELLENALADVIAFFDKTNDQKTKRKYENKFVELTNAKNAT
ncbi:Tetratricopeptide repeat-containing protein [Lentibacillus persicus]|uniref:Tetratricopeptide repeat-containing protein n=1 Tax=Lentibacillus persicus TaxID=640948 RepID=A0A1I1SHM4_9BACI|nr:tetratricopeptide repeat protein [Lentibacillus persicus]SFD45987.1 Tetratricopeptide repeat-containing protein [Lentibacillus persicus]